MRKKGCCPYEFITSTRTPEMLSDFTGSPTTLSSSNPRPPYGVRPRAPHVPAHGALHDDVLASGLARDLDGGSSGGDLVGHTVSLAGIVSSAKLHETTS